LGTAIELSSIGSSSIAKTFSGVPLSESYREYNSSTLKPSQNYFSLEGIPQPMLQMAAIGLVV